MDPNGPPVFWVDGVRFKNEAVKVKDLQNYRDADVDEVFGGLNSLDIAFAPEEEKDKLARQLLAQAENTPMSVFKNEEADQWIKDIIHLGLFNPESLGKQIHCNFCNEFLECSTKHFEKHPYIFVRGCVYCDHPIRFGDFAEYWDHLKLHHPKEVLHFH